MRRTGLWILLCALVPLAFYAGYRSARPPSPAAAGRKVLYYVDPMNPAFRSPKPGIAPCGMALEPVYEEGAVSGTAAGNGAIAVGADRQQLIGVKVEEATVKPARHALRLLGRVAVDETRVHQLSAFTRGWIRELGAATAGSLVAKGEVLGAYYAPDVLSPQQTFLYTVGALENLKKTGSNPYDNLQGGTQIAAYQKNLQTGRQTLLNLGMSGEQIDEIAAARKPSVLVQLRSPAQGVVLARTVALGQSFEAGAELYRVADLRRVWVLADAFEGDERFLRPGAAATVTVPGTPTPLKARVAKALPGFDEATRTLKVRLELDNPGLALRPGMFVDVDLPVDRGPSLTLPKEAVLDSGTRRVVFVEKRPGVFEPRQVKTGWRYGGEVQILSGLMEGERVVTSGNFLLDSESRMRAASALSQVPRGVDPVCGMPVDDGAARAAGLTSAYAGTTYSFCTPRCKAEFDRDPRRHAAASSRGEPAEAPRAPPAGAMQSAAAPRTPAGSMPHQGHEMDAAHEGQEPAGKAAGGKGSEGHRAEERPEEPAPGAAVPDAGPGDGGAGR